jgi:hypothetical protein
LAATYGDLWTEPTRPWTNTPRGGAIIHRCFDDNVHEFMDVLQRALPGSPQRELYRAYNFLAGSMMLALSRTERVDRLSDGLCHAKDLEDAGTSP